MAGDRYIRALCFGAGYGGRTLMGVVRSLGRRGVPVIAVSHQADSPARFSRYCRHVLAAADPDALEGQLIAFARRGEDRPVLLPVGDAEVGFVSKRAAALSPWFRFHVPAPDVLAVLASKRSQYETATKLGLHIPRTYFDLTSGAVADAPVEYPVVVKPVVSGAWPFGRSKAQVTANAADLAGCLARCERAGADAIVQSIVPGLPWDYYRVNVYIARDGRLAVCGSLRKYRQYPLGFGLGSLLESVAMPKLEERVVQFLRDLRFSGVAGVEFKRDARDGSFRLMEINPRFELQNHLSATAGADQAWAMYRDLAELPPLPCPPYRTGLRWIAVNLDLKACRDLYAHGELTLAEWLRSVAPVRTASLLTLDDPGPALYATVAPVLNRLLRPAPPATAPRHSQTAP